jgi:hypothetical protein
MERKERETSKSENGSLFSTNHSDFSYNFLPIFWKLNRTFSHKRLGNPGIHINTKKFKGTQ